MARWHSAIEILVSRKRDETIYCKWCLFSVEHYCKLALISSYNCGVDGAVGDAGGWLLFKRHGTFLRPIGGWARCLARDRAPTSVGGGCSGVVSDCGVGAVGIGCVITRNGDDAADAHDDAENNEDSDDVLARLFTLEAFGISVLSQPAILFFACSLVCSHDL